MKELGGRCFQVLPSKVPRISNQIEAYCYMLLVHSSNIHNHESDDRWRRIFSKVEVQGCTWMEAILHEYHISRSQ